MRQSHPVYVTPAQAGVHEHSKGFWIPAFAGMTCRRDGIKGKLDESNE